TRRRARSDRRSGAGTRADCACRARGVCRMRRLRLGLLGCGTGGGGFVRLVAAERDRIRARYAVDPEIVRILVRDPHKERDVDRGLLTTSALDVLDAGGDLIVEAIGGVHTAGTFVRRAIARGCDV